MNMNSLKQKIYRNNINDANFSKVVRCIQQQNHNVAQQVLREKNNYKQEDVLIGNVITNTTQLFQFIDMQQYSNNINQQLIQTQFSYVQQLLQQFIMNNDEYTQQCLIESLEQLYKLQDDQFIIIEQLAYTIQYTENQQDQLIIMFKNVYEKYNKLPSFYIQKQIDIWVYQALVTMYLIPILEDNHDMVLRRQLHFIRVLVSRIMKNNGCENSYTQQVLVDYQSNQNQKRMIIQHLKKQLGAQGNDLDIPTKDYNGLFSINHTHSAQTFNHTHSAQTFNHNQNQPTQNIQTYPNVISNVHTLYIAFLHVSLFILNNNIRLLQNQDLIDSDQKLLNVYLIQQQTLQSLIGSFSQSYDTALFKVLMDEYKYQIQQQFNMVETHQNIPQVTQLEDDIPQQELIEFKQSESTDATQQILGDMKKILFLLTDVNGQQKHNKQQTDYMFRNVLQMIATCPEDIKSQFLPNEINDLQCVTIDAISDKYINRETTNYEQLIRMFIHLTDNKILFQLYIDAYDYEQLMNVSIKKIIEDVIELYQLDNRVDSIYQSLLSYCIQINIITPIKTIDDITFKLEQMNKKNKDEYINKIKSKSKLLYYIDTTTFCNETLNYYTLSAKQQQLFQDDSDIQLFKQLTISDSQYTFYNQLKQKQCYNAIFVPYFQIFKYVGLSNKSIKLKRFLNNYQEIINYKSQDVSHVSTILSMGNETVLEKSNWYIDKTCAIAITSKKKNYGSYVTFISQLVQSYPNIKILIYERADGEDSDNDSDSVNEYEQSQLINVAKSHNTSRSTITCGIIVNDSLTSGTSGTSATSKLSDLGESYDTSDDQQLTSEQQFNQLVQDIPENIQIITSKKHAKDFSTKVKLFQKYCNEKDYLLVINQQCAPIFTKLQIPKLFSELMKHNLPALEIFPQNFRQCHNKELKQIISHQVGILKTQAPGKIVLIDLAKYNCNVPFVNHNIQLNKYSGFQYS